MIDVILNGCNGRMGQMLTVLIKETDDMKIVAGIDLNKVSASDYPVFGSLSECNISADVLIDFSHPDTLLSLVPEAISRNLPIVIATTGLSDDYIKLLTNAAKSIPVFRSANMTLGINLIEQLIQSAVKTLGNKFDIEIVEKHHRMKKDSPSGTAIMLAEAVNSVRTEKLKYVYGREGADCQRKPDELGIHSIRGGTIVGEHDVYFTGTDEVIKISHSAFSRQVFATGALAGARFLTSCKPGMYNMHDFINQTSAVTTFCSYSDEALICLNNLPSDLISIAEIYGEFAESNIFIDMISHSGSTSQSISFTVKTRDVDAAEQLIDGIKNRHPGVSIEISKSITKISVEGPGMEYQSGIAYRLFSILADKKIDILAVTTSEAKISCVLRNEDASSAAELIKTEFGI